jgi:hypothetical protein
MRSLPQRVGTHGNGLGLRQVGGYNRYLAMKRTFIGHSHGHRR